jgi:predicted HTH domain antitoxin
MSQVVLEILLAVQLYRRGGISLSRGAEIKVAIIALL